MTFAGYAKKQNGRQRAFEFQLQQFLTVLTVNKENVKTKLDGKKDITGEL